jgi:hypothetical protein
VLVARLPSPGGGTVVGVTAHASFGQAAVFRRDAVRIVHPGGRRERLRAGAELVLAHEELLGQR